MAASVKLPAIFTSTHQTSGLPGFPSIDVFGQAGEPVYAPVGGTIVYPHMIDWNKQDRVGGMTGYLQGDNNKTYFLTHLGGDLPSGHIAAGQQIGTVGAVPGGWWDPHVHEGMYSGIYDPPGADSTRSLSSASYSSSPLASSIAEIARRYNVDPAAALAVASTEGLGGGIGDQGTSFGPFQLHYGGAYPSYAPRGQSASQAWATSPAGIEYAIRKIASVAGGLKGRAAVNAIVRQFERPADPGNEVSKAWSRYGSYGNISTAPGASGTTGSPASPFSSISPERNGPSPFMEIFKQLMSGGSTKSWVDPFVYKPFGA